MRYPATSSTSRSRDGSARREPMPHVARRPSRHPADRLHVVATRRTTTSRFSAGWRRARAPHLAIEAARRAGVRLKLAGEIQPYFTTTGSSRSARYIDGEQVEYVGEADLALKNELLVAGAGAAVPDSVGRAVRPGDDRGDGLRHAGARVCRRRRRRDRGRRRERLDLPGRRTRWPADRGARHRAGRRAATFVDEHFSVANGWRSDTSTCIDARDRTRSASAAGDWRPEWKT